MVGHTSDTIARKSAPPISVLLTYVGKGVPDERQLCFAAPGGANRNKTPVETGKGVDILVLEDRRELFGIVVPDLESDQHADIADDRSTHRREAITPQANLWRLADRRH